MTQSNLDSFTLATYTLTFTPINPIPITGAIIVRIPNEVTLSSDKASCYVILNQYITDVCSMDGIQFKVENAFKNQASPYVN